MVKQFIQMVEEHLNWMIKKKVLITPEGITKIKLEKKYFLSKKINYFFTGKIINSKSNLKDILKNDPQKFLLSELSIRKKNKLPPFFRLISLIIAAKSERDSLQGANEIKKKLIPINDIEILGPV